MENNHLQQGGENNGRDDIRNFIANIKCGRCGQQYEPGNINVVGRLAYLLLSIVYCPSCNNIGLVVVNTKGDKEIETATDLTEAEISQFFEPISSSDVLDTHIFLKDFKGDFATFFSNYC